jgi:hypothetical protein
MSNQRTGATAVLTHFFYKEVEVVVHRKLGKTPSYFETHFYPDGSVQAEITEQMSRPRMVLSAKRPDKTVFGRCENDREPE